MKEYRARIARARTTRGLDRIIKQAAKDPALTPSQRLTLLIEANLRDLWETPPAAGDHFPVAC